MLTKNIVLIGLSGSGKTAFSKRLAARYGLTPVSYTHLTLPTRIKV